MQFTLTLNTLSKARHSYWRSLLSDLTVLPVVALPGKRVYVVNRWVESTTLAQVSVNVFLKNSQFDS